MNYLRSRRGLTLLECLIYLVFFSFIALSSMSLLSQLWVKSLQQAKKDQSLLILYSALDAFSKDLHAAPQKKSDWKVQSSTMLVWKHNDKDLGWFIEKNRLLRKMGSFSEKENTIRGKQSNMIAPIKNGSFSWHQQGSLTLFTLSLSDELNKVKSTVGLYVH